MLGYITYGVISYRGETYGGEFYRDISYYQWILLLYKSSLSSRMAMELNFYFSKNAKPKPYIFSSSTLLLI